MSGSSDHPPAGGVARFPITAVGGRPGTDSEVESSRREDLLVVEEPLEIRVIVDSEAAGSVGACHSVAITMRSPGHDDELACGFLRAEGVINGPGDVWRVARCEDADDDSAGNIVEVHLVPGVDFDPARFRRNVYVSSSCGVCGKESIEQLKALGGTPPRGDFTIAAAAAQGMPETLRAAQAVFSSTGGLHACGLFAPSGELELVREDVGRHNAVDKVVGRLLFDGELPASSRVLLVSGRASFELVHKAMAAGVSTLLAVGAPSSLAVETARAFGMTLVGFLSTERFNVYCGEQRIGE